MFLYEARTPQGIEIAAATKIHEFNSLSASETAISQTKLQFTKFPSYHDMKPGAMKLGRCNFVLRIGIANQKTHERKQWETYNGTKRIFKLREIRR